MAIEILGADEVAAMRRAGRAAAATLAMVGARISPGISTADIDAWVRADTVRRGGRPSQLGFHGFPAAVCTSRNAVVCHGIPSRREQLAPGDIINVDVTTELGGFHGDTSATLFVGAPGAEARHVVETARRCRHAGIAEVRDGARLGDIGARAAAWCASSAGTESAASCTHRRRSCTSGHAGWACACARAWPSPSSR
jgi:methionyl aminopeptidase